MKSNYTKKKYITVSKGDLNDIIKEEIQKRYDIIDNDIAAQMLSIALVTLELCYGWRDVELHRYMNDLRAIALLADDTNIFGKTLNTNGFLEHLASRYNIDLHKEISDM